MVYDHRGRELGHGSVRLGCRGALATVLIKVTGSGRAAGQASTEALCCLDSLRRQRQSASGARGWYCRGRNWRTGSPGVEAIPRTVASATPEVSPEDPTRLTSRSSGLAAMPNGKWRRPCSLARTSPRQRTTLGWSMSSTHV